MKRSAAAITATAVEVFEALAKTASTLSAYNSPEFSKATAVLDKECTRLSRMAFTYTGLDAYTGWGARLREWMLNMTNAYEETLTRNEALGRARWAESGGFVERLDLFKAAASGEITQEYALELMK
jgi:hypothetical protein